MVKNAVLLNIFCQKLLTTTKQCSTIKRLQSSRNESKGFRLYLHAVCVTLTNKCLGMRLAYKPLLKGALFLCSAPTSKNLLTLSGKCVSMFIVFCPPSIENKKEPCCAERWFSENHRKASGLWFSCMQTTKR